MKKWYGKNLLLAWIISLSLANISFAQQNSFSIDRTINDVKAFMKNFVITDNWLSNWTPKVFLNWAERSIKIGNSIIDWKNWKIWIWASTPTYNVEVRNWETNIPSWVNGWIKIWENQIIENNSILNILSDKNIFNGELNFYTDPNNNFDTTTSPDPKMHVDWDWVDISTNTKLQNTITINWAINIEKWAIQNYRVKNPDLDFWSVQTQHLQNSVIDENKIAPLQVNHNVLWTWAITNKKIWTGQITSDIINNWAITSDHIKVDQITNEQIAIWTITKDDINSKEIQRKIQPCPSDTSETALEVLQVVEEDWSVKCIPKRVFWEFKSNNGNPNNNWNGKWVCGATTNWQTFTSLAQLQSSNNLCDSWTASNPVPANWSQATWTCTWNNWKSQTCGANINPQSNWGVWACNLSWVKLDPTLVLSHLWTTNPFSIFWWLLWSLYWTQPTHMDQNWKQYRKFDAFNWKCSIPASIFSTEQVWAVYEKEATWSI